MNLRFLLVQGAYLSALVGLVGLWATTPSKEQYRDFAADHLSEHINQEMNTFCLTLQNIQRMPTELRDQVNKQIKVKVRTSVLVKDGIEQAKSAIEAGGLSGLAVDYITEEGLKQFNQSFPTKTVQNSIKKRKLSKQPRLSKFLPEPLNPVKHIAKRLAAVAEKLPDREMPLGQYLQISTVDGQCSNMAAAVAGESKLSIQQAVRQDLFTQSENFFIFSLHRTTYTSNVFPSYRFSAVGVLNHFFIYNHEKGTTAVAVNPASFPTQP